MHFCTAVDVAAAAAGGKQKTGESVNVRKSFLALFELIASTELGEKLKHTNNDRLTQSHKDSFKLWLIIFLETGKGAK